MNRICLSSYDSLRIKPEVMEENNNSCPIGMGRGQEIKYCNNCVGDCYGDPAQQPRVLKVDLRMGRLYKALSSGVEDFRSMKGAQHVNVFLVIVNWVGSKDLCLGRGHLNWRGFG